MKAKKTKSKKNTYLVVQTTYVSMVIKADDYLDAETQMRDMMSREDPEYIKALEGAVDEFDAQQTRGD